MADNNKTDNNTDFDPSRRRFMKNTGMIVGGVAGGSLLGGLLTDQFETQEKTAPDKDKKSEKLPTDARMFFTRYEDFQVLGQATERIFPEDDNGPGAIELGVPFFIDKQLAGDFGSNEKEYMKGPKQEVGGIDTYQTLMDRGSVMIEGLRKINAESKDRHDSKFYEAKEDQQTSILQDLVSQKIELDGVDSRTFFDLLRQMTIEGVYSDPLYGGNKDMQGWKMKEYPGVRAGYSDLIDSAEFQKLEPTSLTDYQRSG